MSLALLLSNVPFSCPLKTSDNQQLRDVLRKSHDLPGTLTLEHI